MLKARVGQPFGLGLGQPRNPAFLGVLAQQSIDARRKTQVVDGDLADVEGAHAAMVATWQPGTRTAQAYGSYSLRLLPTRSASSGDFFTTGNANEMMRESALFGDGRPRAFMSFLLSIWILPSTLGTVSGA